MTGASVAVPSSSRMLAALARSADAVARHVILALGAVLLFQILATVALFFSVNRNDWLTYQGGDQIWLVTSGWLLGKGTVSYALTGHAWPMLLAPLTWITGSSSVQLLPLTTILQVGVLGPIATLAVYDIGARLAGRLAGVWCASAFAVAPFVAIPYFVQRYHDSWVDQFLPQALGLTQQADFPSVVAVLVSAALTVRALQAGAHREAVLAGTFAGVALALKPANALFLLGPALAFVLARRWRQAGLFAVSLAPALVALTLWKSARARRGAAFRRRPGATGDRARRPARPVTDELVRADDPPERRHVEAEHVGDPRVHMERAGPPVPPPRRRARRRAALDRCLGPPPRVAARVRRREGRRRRRDRRVRQLLAADHAGAPGLRTPQRLRAAPRPDLPRPDGADGSRRCPVGVPDAARRSRSWRSSPIVPIGVILASDSVLVAQQPGASRAYVIPELVVNEIGVPADPDVISLEVRRVGNANELTWTDSTKRARTFYRVYRGVPVEGFSEMVCDQRGVSRCDLRAETLVTTRDQPYLDPESPAGRDLPGRRRGELARRREPRRRLRDQPARGSVAGSRASSRSSASTRARSSATSWARRTLSSVSRERTVE